MLGHFSTQHFDPARQYLVFLCSLAPTPTQKHKDSDKYPGA